MQKSHKNDVIVTIVFCNNVKLWFICVSLLSRFDGMKKASIKIIVCMSKSCVLFLKCFLRKSIRFWLNICISLVGESRAGSLS